MKTANTIIIILIAALSTLAGITDKSTSKGRSAAIIAAAATLALVAMGIWGY